MGPGQAGSRPGERHPAAILLALLGVAAGVGVAVSPFLPLWKRVLITGESTWNLTNSVGPRNSLHTISMIGVVLAIVLGTAFALLNLIALGPKSLAPARVAVGFLCAIGMGALALAGTSLSAEGVEWAWGMWFALVVGIIAFVLGALALVDRRP